MLVRSGKSYGDESSFETITCHASVEVKIVLESKNEIIPVFEINGNSTQRFLCNVRDYY